MSDASDLVTRFVKEWDGSPSAETIAAYFTADALYHNIPMDPITGAENIGKMLGGMAANMQGAGWEVKHQVAVGNVVMNERIDKFKMGDRVIGLPVAGIFVVKAGKIAEWRDYFDLGMWQKALAG